jgi:uncharacterized membrane protein
MGNPTRVQLGDWITRSWDLLRAEWLTWSLMTFVYFIPMAVVYVIAQVAQFKLGLHTPPPSRALEAFLQSIGQSLTISLVTSFLMVLCGSVFLGGIYRAAFKQMAGEKITPGDVFTGFDKFPAIFVASVIIGVIQFLAALLCYIPMFIAQGLLFLTVPFIVREDLDPLEAVRRSFQTTKDEWLMFTVTAVVAGLLAVLGLFACLVGILFSYPLLFLITAHAYRSMTGAESVQPAVHPAMGKRCRRCGAVLPQEAAFCDRCGVGQT